MNKTTKNALLFSILLTAGAQLAQAQGHPITARGNSAQSSFASDGIDSVNLFNRNLVLTLPLGQRFPLGPALSYGFTLYYNSNVWDVEEAFNCSNETLPCTRLEPGKSFNAGLGWTLSFGRLLHPDDTENESDRWVYIGPDSSRHYFYDTLHLDETPSSGCGTLGCTWQYTRDGSYLRLNRSTLKVEFPDGSTHTFGGPKGELTDLRDQFGNYLSVSVGSNSWGLSDRYGRTHSVTFSTEAGVKVVSSVTMAAFNGSSVSYQFSYAPTTIHRPYMDTDDDNGPTVSVPLLYDISAPAINYSLGRLTAPSYYFGAAGTEEPSGQLRRIVLPTKGTLEWTYSKIEYPVAQTFQHLEHGFGVATKVSTDPWGTGGTWAYVSALHPPSPSPPTELRTTVTYPSNGKKVHYFAVPRVISTATWTGWEYGLPFSPSNPGGGEYLSSVTKNASGNLLRTEWLAFTHDKLPSTPSAEDWYNSNRRVFSSVTLYQEDGNRYAERNLSSFDGLGHFRTTHFTDTFGDGTDRTETTQFNPTRGCYEIDLATNNQLCTGASAFVPLSPSDRWVLGTFSYRRQTEGGASAQQEFDFQTTGPTTGFLNCVRTLKTGTDRGQNDVLTTFANDGFGFTDFEKHWGGDDQSLPTGSGCGTPTAPAYWIDHTYASGVREKSQYRTSGGSAMNFYSLNSTTDNNTGLPRHVYDESGYWTELTYDAHGRLTEVEPKSAINAEREAKTRYTYTAAGGNPAKINVIRSCPTGDSSCSGYFGESETHLDGFGRPWKELVRQPNGSTWARRETTYNAMGWRTGFSEMGASTGNLSWNTFSQFDTHGRPGRLTKADDKQVNFYYSGSREFTRENKVFTGASEVSSSTTERYDSLGRLRKVFEPSRPDGTNVDTTYYYDVGNRLTRVHQNAGDSQNRYFSYDNRGFLISEQHPEKGPQGAGNGVVSYLSYDALGNASEVRDGATARSLLFGFDAAQRLLTVSEGGVGGRILKEFAYGSSGSGLAKVVTAKRHNYLPAPLNTDYLVTETYVYDGVGRRPSSRTTQTHYFGADQAQFKQYWTYDRGGNATTIDYPRCYDGGCPATGTPARTVTNTFSNGWLTAISGWTQASGNHSWATTIGYHLNGMLNAVGYANNVSQLIYNDPDNMARPYNIEYIRTSTGVPFGDLGPIEYDGSGNIKKLEDRDLTYDLASRLKAGSLWVNGVVRSYSAAFDGFGNITSLTQNGTIRNTPTSTSTNRLTGAFYDEGGNMTSWNGASYTYDRLNMMTRLTNGTEDFVFAYTADDERILEYKLTGGHWKTALRDLDGKVLREFWVDSGWASEDLIYRGTTLLASAHPTEGTKFFGPDHLGTPRAVFSAAGNLIGLHTYYPFGEEATATNQDAQQMKFTGHERDQLGTPTNPADDLDYMHARHYAPLTGRFLSFDPVGGSPKTPQSWNRYAYVLGNPQKYTDPTGMVAESWASFSASLIVQLPSEIITVTASPINARTMDQSTYQNFLNASLGGIQTIGTSPSEPRARGVVRSTLLTALMFSATAVMGCTGEIASSPSTDMACSVALGGISQAGARTFTDPRFAAQLERQLEEAGVKSVLKSLSSLEQRLAEHQAKLATSVYKSSIEREIRTFSKQIATVREFLESKGLWK